MHISPLNTEEFIKERNEIDTVEKLWQFTKKYGVLSFHKFEVFDIARRIAAKAYDNGLDDGGANPS